MRPVHSLLPLLVLLLSGGPAARAQAPAGGAGTHAFVGVHVVDLAGDSIQPRRTVIVRDGRIAAVGPADSVVVPADAERIELRGAFLMPGLADLHSHAIDPSVLPLYLASGVTTVQLLNAGPEVLEWARAAEDGRLLGPRIAACAGPVSGIATAEAARAAVAERSALGFDCIKPYDGLSREAFAALVAEADRRRVRTVSHIPRKLGWQDMLEVAPGAVAHAEELLYSPIESAADLDRIVREMAERRIGLVTTLVNYDYISRQPAQLDRLLERDELRLVPAVERRAWSPALNRYAKWFGAPDVPRLRRLLGFQRDLVRRLHAAGAPVLLGTDAGNTFVVPGVSVHEELRQLVAAGLTPAAALRAGTTEAARFLGVAGERGTVAVGMQADLVLVLGNPLADVASAELVAGTMTRGRWLPAERLRAELARLREALRLEEELVRRVEGEGVDAALRWLAGRPDAATLRPRALNELGYQLWRLEQRLPEAVRVFEANARLHPEWGSAAESLAEARAAEAP
ncbi:MAG TPA: amidohydrolase family protein [Longimicrobiaceae bacterium]|nr:amidohydrolase family protein [Longimicrobiaceae bacterium]